MEFERIDDLGINELKIIQNTKYFCFGIDSVLLANFITSNSEKNDILELCSGGGVISVILSAKKKSSKIYAVELQDEMFDLLNRNIIINKLEKKIITINDDIKNVNIIRRKLLENSNKDSFDIICANPPYKKISTGIVNKNDVKYVARHEVACTLEDIFNTSSKLLKTKGKLFLVHKPERLSDLVSVARKYKLEAKKIQFVYPTKESKASIVLIEYAKDGGNELNILEPIIEFDDDGNYTQKIYDMYGSIKKE